MFQQPIKFVQIIENDINPFVDAWEEEKQFPAHNVFKTLGNAGFLGVNKPTGKLQLVKVSCDIV